MKTVFLILLAFNTMLAVAQTDKTGCKEIEPAYMNRIQGFYLNNCEFSEYKDIEFFYNGLDGKSVRVRKAGEYRRLFYSKDKNETRKVSGDQIRLNYANAVIKSKGNSLSTNNAFFSFSNNGNEVFMKIDDAVDSDDKAFVVTIIEVKKMQQEIVMTISEAIEKDGKALLYGILFDTGKSEIKPESAGALKQITDYLNANPAVKIIIVGHTDITGNFLSNMTLSKERAESIKTYLSTIGKIDITRLQSDGVGPLCPVSTNATDDGRKLNRRVEIVKQ
jgi:outer membrane protein OmpA-like peptidoglycan-associated protein